MILVTGSEGFIGSHLVKALARQDVILADPRRAETDYDYILKMYAIEAIFHLGAISDTTCTDAKALEETNVRLTVRLGRFAESRGIPFIYASSASVYGNGHGPLNAYALSKLSADEIMEARVGGQWYGLRFFNVYGPGEEHKGEQRSMVSKAIDAYRNGEAPRFYDLSAKRDFVHVEDVVVTMIWMWKRLPQPDIYDVGTGQARSVMEMCSVIQQAMDISQAATETGVPAEMKGKLQTYTRANLDRLRDDAGYTQRFMTLEQGVALTLSA